MNSFRSVERAIEFEIERQAAALEAGEPLVQETRGWDDERGRRRTGCGSRRRATTTATSPSRTCRRCTSTAAWLAADPRRAAGAAGGAPRAVSRGLGLSAYDAAVLVADPAMTVAFEATRAAGPGAAGQGRREPRHRRRTARAAKVRRSRPDGLVDRATAGELADLVGADRRRVRCRGRTPRRCSPSISRPARPVGDDRRPSRPAPDQRHVGAWTRSSTRCWRPTQRRSRTWRRASRRRSASLSAR